MKVIKSVTCTGTINHRDAFFKASLCTQDLLTSLIFAVTIRNPEDEINNLPRVKDILNGRIEKRFLRGIYNSKVGKLTSLITLPPGTPQLCSKEAMEAMLKQFKRVKERDLANELGLKWNLKEGDIVRELSVDSGNEVKTDGPGITGVSHTKTRPDISHGETNTEGETAISDGSPSKT